MGHLKSFMENSLFLPTPAPWSHRASGCHQQCGHGSPEDHTDLLAALSAPCPTVLPAQEQFGVVLVFQVLLDEVREQLLQHVGGVLQLALQTRHDE